MISEIKITSDIVEQSRNYVLNMFEKRLSDMYVFHSSEHTLDVYRNSLIIGGESGLSEDDLNCLAVSALFHDVGYIQHYEDHEIVSVAYAKEFLNGLEVDAEIVRQVERAIYATKVPQQPKDLISMALCDADLMYLTTENYFELAEKLYQEWKLTGKYILSNNELLKLSVEFFENHHYCTKYGKEILAPRKSHTLRQIKSRLV